MENPFAGYGSIDCHFIGREIELKTIESRLLGEENFGNLAIFGVPQIGKSCLVYQGLIAKRSELAERKIVVIMIDLIKKKFENLLLELIRKSKEQMEQYIITSNDTNFLKQYDNINIEDLEEKIKSYLKLLKQKQIRLIAIFDNFDFAQEFSPDNFLFLRNLAYETDYNLVYVTVSRKELVNISNKVKDYSNFAGIFVDQPLLTFSTEDWQQYFAILQNHDYSLSEEQKNEIIYFCGKHPYLLNVFGFYCIKEKNEKNEKIIAKVQENLTRFYDDLILFIQKIEVNYYDKLLDILFNPKANVTREIVADFRRYGILNEQNQVFSEHFREYLKECYQQKKNCKISVEINSVIDNNVINTDTEASFKQNKDTWEILYKGQKIALKHYLGVSYIAYLLHRPNRFVPTTELEEFFDKTKNVEGKSEEKSEEQSRKAVTNSINRSIDHIKEKHSQLGDYLKENIRKGSRCRYYSTEPIAWEISYEE